MQAWGSTNGPLELASVSLSEVEWAGVLSCGLIAQHPSSVTTSCQFAGDKKRARYKVAGVMSRVQSMWL